ncbi:MAG TPA: prephenate dehydratase domain-containing protein [Pyrinomonadaceae bacterium]|jgi:prephenate dehydratase|nr:prephenate dehydratase domain-containing protein [Pyrinomonadaceae bacterium]
MMKVSPVKTSRDWRGPLRVAFQGERGAFSEEAVTLLLGAGVTAVPRPTFDALFSSVEEGLADCVVAPVENTLAGFVVRVHELLGESSLRVEGEVVLRISQCLVACRGAAFSDVREVESHPVALAQCRRFFEAHAHIKAVESDDTAASVRRVVERGDHARAAIASERAARLYGGVVLRSHVEDSRENYTRFLLLTPARAAEVYA